MINKRRVGYYALGGLVAGLVLGVAWGLFHPKTTTAPTVTTGQNTNRNVTNANSALTNVSLSGVTIFSTLDLPDRDPVYDFSAEIPSAWAVEYVAASQAITIYDPRGAGETSLANAKIFIKYFTASNFETLTTVDILSQQATTIIGRPAMTYVIKKKSTAPDFPHQPTWRNVQHRVTDLRLSDASPSTFYVFAQAPDVSDSIFSTFLNSLKFNAEMTTN